MISQKAHLEEAQTDEDLRRRKWRWNAALAFAIALTSISALIGLIFDDLPAGWTGPYERASALISRAALIFIFPSLLFVAHCFDKAKEADLAVRAAACKRSGMQCDPPGETRVGR